MNTIILIRILSFYEECGIISIDTQLIPSNTDIYYLKIIYKRKDGVIVMDAYYINNKLKTYDIDFLGDRTLCKK